MYHLENHGKIIDDKGGYMKLPQVCDLNSQNNEVGTMYLNNNNVTLQATPLPATANNKANALVISITDKRNSLMARDCSLNSEPDLYGKRTRRLSTKEFYVFYGHRWYVLIVVCLLALSNATLWLSYTNISKFTIPFYCNLSSEEVNKPSYCDIGVWSSQIFQIVGILTGVLGMFITDKYGIKVSCILGCTFNALGALLRVISAMPVLSLGSRLPVLYFGQTMAAMSQCFFLCLSPKVAEYWFGDHQRAFANSLSFSANPIGVAFGTLLPNFVVNDAIVGSNQNDYQLLTLNLILFVIAFITVVLSFFVQNKPATAPSPSAFLDHSTEFLAGLKILFRCKMLYVQLFTFGIAFAIQWSLPVFAELMLDEIGYKKIPPYLVVLGAITGTIGSIVGGSYIDRTKNFKEFILNSYIAICVITFSLNFHIRQPFFSNEQTLSSHIWIGILVAALGYFTIPIFPIGLELCVETTYPSPEASSSGILVITGQFFLFIIMYVMQQLQGTTWLYGDSMEFETNAKIIDLNDDVCRQKLFKSNYLLSIDFWCAISLFGVIFTAIFLKPRYLRLEYELEEGIKNAAGKKREQASKEK
uniref:MFS domain-containing protein n=1 Tax=Rhabditophanes sp. KR3021 TaxID=114890 RepID=A0AC35UBD2_9BILA